MDFQKNLQESRISMAPVIQQKHVLRACVCIGKNASSGVGSFLSPSKQNIYNSVHHSVNSNFILANLEFSFFFGKYSSSSSAAAASTHIGVVLIM
ncbi:hypothetical protein DERF_003735 [Dermatophagoides farinae]|uniref:Uncharacterized protein n=1 Tax=Dermatophagoides farinae TaxID=6954 RepID=A0A922IFH8_DERFA|nr:hypothetical protein DERF_003735 [Dermatophagoides farinae]